MIYLPYNEFYASALRLEEGELEESHQGLIEIVHWRNRKVKFQDIEQPVRMVALMYQEHWDSFFTLGLYYGTECHRRGLANKRELKTWQNYWQNERKFRRMVKHPEFPDEFYESVRMYLAWLRPDPYLDRFALEEEPFMEPEILWPRPSK